VLKFNLAESVHNKFVIETKTSLDNESVSTPTEPSVPQTTGTPSHLEPTLPGPSSGRGSIDQLDVPTMAEPSTTLRLAQALPVFPIGLENEHQLDLPTITKTTTSTPQMVPCPDSELSLPAPATGPGNKHDDAMSITLETTAHLGGGLMLHRVSVPLRKVRVSFCKVSVPLRKVSIPLRRVSVPLRKVRVSFRKVSIPLHKVSVPLRKVSVPLRKVRASFRKVGIPLRKVSLLLSRVSLPLCKVRASLSRVAYLLHKVSALLSRVAYLLHKVTAVTAPLYKVTNVVQ
jgi:hypothetical protein